MKMPEKPASARWDYDDGADALYIQVGELTSAVGVDLGAGIIARYDEDHEQLVGITLLGIRDRLLEELEKDDWADKIYRRKRLVEILRKPTAKMRAQLKNMKANGRRSMKRPDFVWRSLLQSSATRGNSRGWDGLIEDSENYDRVAFDALAGLSEKARIRTLEETLTHAKVRWSSSKARELSINYKLIERMGGLSAAKEVAMLSQGRSAKIAFMQQFKGIGPKYARNIWMDVYHPEFRNSVAVDERIKSITRKVGYSFGDHEYEAHERFYQEIAREAGLEPWELDRILYHFRWEIEEQLDA
jgi:hypothetical protein